MASQGQRLSHKAGEVAGQAQVKKDELMDQAQEGINRASNNDQSANVTAQATQFLQQTGEQMKSMAQGAAEAVKNTLGMNNDTTTTTTTTANRSSNPSNSN